MLILFFFLLKDKYHILIHMYNFEYYNLSLQLKNITLRYILLRILFYAIFCQIDKAYLNFIFLFYIKSNIGNIQQYQLEKRFNYLY